MNGRTSPMKILYRKLTAGDTAQYRTIRLESLKAHPESFGSSFAEQSQLPKLMFEKALAQPVDARFVIGAFDHDDLIDICGFIPFMPGDGPDLSHTGVLIQMYARSAYSGRKIGLGLVNNVIQAARKIPDIEQIFLEFRAGNMSAIRVYEQAGFQVVNDVGQGTAVTNDGVYQMIFRRDN